MLNLVFMGIQGSGKGTQAGMLKDRYGFKHLNIGELLRNYMSEGTSLGDKISKYMVKGELVPDEYIFTIIDEYLHSKVKGLILDGFPRTLNQAEFMEERIPVNYAVFFDLDDQEAIRRLTSRRVCSNCGSTYNLLIKPPKEDNKCDKCGHKLIHRNDDHEEAIVRRINIFHQRTRKLIAFFQEREILIRIDSTQSPQDIHKELVRRINLDK